MTLGILRDSIANKWGDGNNTALQMRIMYSIVAAHATIIERRYPSISRVPDSLKKVIKSTPLTIVNAEDYALGDSRFFIRRTINRIPKPLIFKDYSQFSFVGPTALVVGWNYIPFEQIAGLKFREFTSNQVYYSLSPDGYVLVINWPGKEIRLVYVPENIIDFKNFATPTNEDTIDDDDIEIPDSLVEGIEGLVEERRFKTETGKEDAEINVNDN